MTDKVSNIYTIPGGMPFTDVLAYGLLQQHQEGEINLNETEIYLPNRRSCRTLTESFLKITDGKVTILPKMTPIGDIDIDEILLDHLIPNLSIHEPIQPLARQFLLARLIMARQDTDISYDQALRLAVDLGRLIDQIHAYDLSAEDLETLVPSEYAHHWQITIEFLNIIIQSLPHILNEEKLCNPSEYRNNLLKIKGEQLFKRTFPHPIIAAGTMGSIPATAAFLSQIVQQPNSCLILPGLDKDLDPESWQSLEESHPQYALKNILEITKTDRKQVNLWPHIHLNKLRKYPQSQSLIKARGELISQVMRPASTSQKWMAEDLTEMAINGVTRIDADNLQQEAHIIALIMRQHLEIPEKTITLITPDRNLAKRVKMDLTRWNIDVDDSAGTPLSKTRLGYFLTLTSQLMSREHSMITLLEILKHPLCHFEDQKDKYQTLVSDLEVFALRGPKIENYEEIKTKINLIENEKKRSDLIQFIEKIENIYSQAWQSTKVSLDEWVKQHIEILEKLSLADSLWVEEEGKIAAHLLSNILGHKQWHSKITAEDYIDTLETLMNQETVRAKFQKHPRLKILSPIEGQLQSADIIILAGLNEGIWPVSASHDPWMSRPMRKRFGLPDLERQIGLSAHNFCQHLANDHVILTRSKMNEGAETVPSRWLLRLETVLKKAHLSLPDSENSFYKTLIKSLDETSKIQPYPQPRPTPPVSIRPRQLSVTEIETWLRDPYSIYAKHILKLKKIPDIEESQETRDWGIYVHKVLELYTRLENKTHKSERLKTLKEIADKLLHEEKISSVQKKQWALKFQNIAQWYIEFENKNNILVEKLSEQKGSIKINDFTLTARADRIDIYPDKTVGLVDYKTGTVPHIKNIKLGYFPQLPLMGLIVQNNGFKNLDKESYKINQLSYYKLTGKEGNAGEITNLSGDRDELDSLIHDTQERLRQLIHAFDQLDTPYWSIPNFNHAPRYNDYEHLSRVQEWSSGNDEG